ncbi:hypothetical protein [Nocardia arthritidis]|uniref:Uncharacterized protein n=1 Tax=Nocardia arthritidis TaxID=228602 RepID=A0A6G9YTN6_9NOCA|nr:hypothetical protein [Nocardia arthritidis]QIS16447.1 hypothetical protein F5544_43200 [Nocardia arthritidis]QIS16461.1 hypothetical protein F5544_43270 [Nocardia arthritidis]
MSSSIDNHSGAVLGFLLNAWTISTLALNFSGVTPLPWWLILGPYMIVVSIGLIGLIILGIVSLVEDD